jgi:hypothetical protein
VSTRAIDDGRLSRLADPLDVPTPSIATATVQPPATAFEPVPLLALDELAIDRRPLDPSRRQAGYRSGTSPGYRRRTLRSSSAAHAEGVPPGDGTKRMRDGYLRGALSRPATQRQMDVLAAYVAAGGSVTEAAELVGIRPSTVKRHLADLRARSGLTTEQLIYAGRAGGWLVVPSLESEATDRVFSPPEPGLHRQRSRPSDCDAPMETRRRRSRLSR